MTHESKSETPASMYDWRVAALDAWLNTKSDGGKKPITMEMLNEAGHLDQFHYKGIEANEEILELLQVEASDRLLDVGSGIGGPARYISWKTGCTVDGFDIQPDLVEKANEVAALVGLKERVKFTAMDVCSKEFGERTKTGALYDGYYSILVNLHIPKEARVAMFQNIGRAVKETGALCIEDYILRSSEIQMTAEETKTLKEVVGVAYLPTKQEYREQLEAVGFVDVHFEDMTEIWTQFTVERERQFLADRKKFIDLYGEASYLKMEKFYTTVPRMFLGGRLGGVRITARKPTNVKLERGRVATASKASKRNHLDICIGGKLN